MACCSLVLGVHVDVFLLLHWPKGHAEAPKLSCSHRRCRERPTAKNLILAGPNAVTLYDMQPAEISDLGANVRRIIGSVVAQAV